MIRTTFVVASLLVLGFGVLLHCSGGEINVGPKDAGTDGDADQEACPSGCPTSSFIEVARYSGTELATATSFSMISAQPPWRMNPLWSSIFSNLRPTISEHSNS